MINNTSIIGIDPGFTGAIAVITKMAVSQLIDITLLDMPTLVNARGAAILDPQALAITIGHYKPRAVYMERVSAMPKQGVSSVFRFGESFGIIQGVIGAMGFPIELVTPKSWKAQAGLIGSAKDYSRTVAISRYPDAAPCLTRKKDIGRADALHIAAYGFNHYTGGKV